MPAGKGVSSAMDGKLKSIHGFWIPAILAGKTKIRFVQVTMPSRRRSDEAPFT